MEDDNFDKCLICGEKMEVVDTFSRDDGKVIYHFVCWNCKSGEVKW